MKKFVSLFVAVATLMALAVPALAVRGGQPDKPNKPKPPKVTVAIEASLFQAHEVDDVIVYTIDIANNSGGDVIVEDTLTGFGPITVADGATLGEIERDYFVVSEDFIDPSAVINTVIAKDDSGNVVASDTAETGVSAYEYCDSNGDGDGKFLRPDGYSVCIWQPSQPGDWTFKVTPSDTERPVFVTMNLRDHVPGNWCPFTDEDGDPIGRVKWRGIPPTLTFQVNVPETGICPIGGAGGAFFDVGTPGSFYLATYDDYQITTIGPPPETP